MVKQKMQAQQSATTQQNIFFYTASAWWSLSAREIKAADYAVDCGIQATRRYNAALFLSAIFVP
jgi:hypothetical protein